MTPQLPSGLTIESPDLPALIRPRGPECHVCLGTHDEEIHAATLSVRRWFRDEVTKSFGIPNLI